MGKKRFSSSALTKTYTSSSSAASSSGQTQRSSLSVADKLLKLRLEGIQHERNLSSGTASVSHTAFAANVGPTQVDAELAHMLGQHYIEPQARVKPRNRGHLAPKSWNTKATSRGRVSSQMRLDRKRSHTPGSSLTDLCLAQVTQNIHEYLGCGLSYLPGYIKAQLLACLDGPHDDVVWRDIVPEETDDVHDLDLSLTRPVLSCLRRLVGLQRVRLSISQIELGSVIDALPLVLQELVVCVSASRRSIVSDALTRAYWRRLSSHFIALRSITIVLCQWETGLDREIQELELPDLYALLLDGPDWREAFDTVKDVYFVVSDKSELRQMTDSIRFKEFKSALRHCRKKGRHVECSVVAREQMS